MERNAKRPRKVQRRGLPGGAAAEKPPQEATQGTSATATFPIYILHLGPSIQIVFPENREDLAHPDFWEQTVCLLVARHFEILPRKLANYPYCQRRARIVGNKVYYGETHDPALLRLIREALGNSELVFCYDDHEKRLGGDVRHFKRLAGGRRSSTD